MNQYNRLLKLFPNLSSDKSREFIIGSETAKRNCITASLNMPYPWIWPAYKSFESNTGEIIEAGYWPQHLPIEDYSLNNFLEMYKMFGFEETDSAEYEDGYWKNIIYGTDENNVTHAAHLLKDGRCASKLGTGPLLLHMPESIVCPTYGNIIAYVKRPLPLDKNKFKEIILTT